MSVQIISFFILPLTTFMAAHKGEFRVPTPTQTVVDHPGAVKLIIVGLFLISVATYMITRRKMKEEADRLVVQSAVYSVIWYAGIVYISGVLMAMALPYFAASVSN